LGAYVYVYGWSWVGDGCVFSHVSERRTTFAFMKTNIITQTHLKMQSVKFTLVMGRVENNMAASRNADLIKK
jgi:hypothetical protein